MKFLESAGYTVIFVDLLQGINWGKEAMAVPTFIEYPNEVTKLATYNKYKENLKLKYRFAFISLPIMAFVFYYSIMQFFNAIYTGSFFLHPVLSGGLSIASFFLILVVVVSAWQRDKLESEINKKIEAL